MGRNLAVADYDAEIHGMNMAELVDAGYRHQGGSATDADAEECVNDQFAASLGDRRNVDHLPI